MIIDGVLDGYEYRNALWNNSLTDNEAVIDSLFTFCHQAGPLKCPLYESTPSAIRDRYFGVLATVKQNSVPVPLAEPAQVLTHKDLLNQIFNAAYSPVLSYPLVAATIRAIETSNQTFLAVLAPIVGSSATCDSPASPALSDNGYEAFFAIACGDAEAVPFDPTAYRAFFAALTRVAPTVGPFWALYHLGCTQWPVRATWRYTGPLAAQHTAHPLLVVSPKFDPVTPLVEARGVRARYGGAGLLVQDSYGHTSLAAPSVCTAKLVRAYLEEGTLPMEGTVCEPDELPFVGRVTPSDVQARSEEDERLLDALRGLSKVVPTFGARL